MFSAVDQVWAVLDYEKPCDNLSLLVQCPLRAKSQLDSASATNVLFISVDLRFLDWCVGATGTDLRMDFHSPKSGVKKNFTSIYVY